MTKFLQFCKDYWYLPFFILVVILCWIVFRKKGTPIEQTKLELEAIRAGAETRAAIEHLGAEAAKKQIELKYREELSKLDEKQKKQAKKLAEDPVALSKFLVRAGSSR